MNDIVGKKRVLHLRSSGGLLGAENVVLEIAKFSTQNGWESIVGAINDVNDPYPEFLELADTYGVKCALFKSDGKLDFSCVREIKKFIDKYSIDIIHTHGYKENIYSLMVRSGLPKVSTNHLWKTSTLKAKIYCCIDAILIRLFDEIVGVSDEIVNGMRRVGIKHSFKIANGVDCNKFSVVSRNTSFAEKEVR